MADVRLNRDLTQQLATVTNDRDKAYAGIELQSKKLAAMEKTNAKLRAVLGSAKAAMTYAYEDHSDQFYLNMRDQISEALREGMK